MGPAAPSKDPPGMTRQRVSNAYLFKYDRYVKASRDKWLAKNGKGKKRGKAPSMRLSRISGRTVRFVLLITILCFSGAIVLWVIR